MVDFWRSGTGIAPSGKPEDSFLASFDVIPDGTISDAVVKSFLLVDSNTPFGNKKYYEIKWKLTSGTFKNREVSQKIKCFDGSPLAIDRSLSMLKLIMELFEFKPLHSNAPTDVDLAPMQGRIATIKIAEWELTTQDGKNLTGNHVTEVHASGSVANEVGIKKVTLVATGVPMSALQRNANKVMDLDDVPF